MTRIKSPINGTVDAVDIKVGQAVMPGIPAIRVVNFSKLKVKGEVAETYVSKVKKGDAVVIYFPDINKEITSKVSYSAKVINTLNRTFTVEVDLDTKEAEYHPNMIAILKIVDYETPATFVAPINTIQNSQTEKFVFVAANENGKTVATKKTVTVGLTYNGKAEITSGLSKGDQLITTGYQDLNNGEEVKF